MPNQKAAKLESCQTRKLPNQKVAKLEIRQTRRKRLSRKSKTGEKVSNRFEQKKKKNETEINSS